ncbi:MAG: protein kinase [Blastocatellia bacterium]|nr:protein kinase [Blastocatellia bacterium]
MSPDRNRQLRDLFDRAVELDGSAREALLAETLEDDAELGHELKTLLDLDAADGQFLDRPAISVAARELAGDESRASQARTIPGYRILSKLGAGGMGEVFLAEDEALGRRVALKLLPESLTASADSLARFKREARAASALNHPGIMTVHEIGSAEGVQFIATEFIEGETLRDRLAAGPMTVADVVRIGTAAAEALAVAHEAGIVHRDVKPENIMVRRDGYVKVLDFGLAKSVEPASGDDDRIASLSTIATEPGRMLGTVAYMSPEQLHATGVDERTDVWSLGVVLYELVTGTRPFRGPSAAGVISAILTAEVPPIEVDGVRVSEALEIIIRKSLERDTGLRYRNAREVWEALRSLGEDLAFDERVRLRSGDAEPGREVPSLASGAGSAAVSTASALRFGWQVWAVVAVVFATAAFGMAYRFGAFGAFGGAQAGDEIRSIAVLPFLPVGNEARDEAFELGMADTLITRLGSLRQLDVRPISAVRTYTRTDRDPLAAGRDLKVAAVLDGTLQRSGDRLRVNLRLLRVGDGAVLWAAAIDEASADVFKVQDSISERVVLALRLELSGWEQQQLAKRDTESSEAYQSYVRGRYFLDRRGTEWRRKSVEQFSKAVELDPAYAPAYAGLSDAYAEMVYWGDERPRDYMPKAKAAAERALAIDDSLAEAHTSLGVVFDDFEWKFNEAEQQYRRAIELNPSYALAHQRLGQLLAEKGRFDEAKAESRLALELDPLSLNVNVSLGAVEFLSRDYGAAIEQLNRTLELDPQYVEARGLLGWISVQEGRYDEALRLWMSMAPDDHAESLRAAFAKGGIRRYFERDLELAFERQRRGEELAVFSAMELAYLGRKDEAFVVLERAFEERNSWLGELNVDPSWDPLRSDPRFVDLVRRVGLG